MEAANGVVNGGVVGGVVRGVLELVELSVATVDSVNSVDLVGGVAVNSEGVAAL